MEQRQRRLVLFGLAAIFTSALFLKGHAPGNYHRDVAFLCCSSSSVTIRITGISSPGVYSFSGGSTAADVIKLTTPPCPPGKPVSPLLHTVLKSGDVVAVYGKPAENTGIYLKKMNAGELILLGIPLSPDQMTRADWQFVPGIGAKMAERIVEDRQNYGNFGCFKSLSRVPGMGEKKLDGIRKFFRP